MTTFTNCPFCGADMAGGTHIVGMSCPQLRVAERSEVVSAPQGKDVIREAIKKRYIEEHGEESYRQICEVESVDGGARPVFSLGDSARLLDIISEMTYSRTVKTVSGKHAVLWGVMPSGHHFGYVVQCSLATAWTSDGKNACGYSDYDIPGESMLALCAGATDGGARPDLPIESRCVHCESKIYWQKTMPTDSTCARGYWYSNTTGSGCPKSEFGHERGATDGGARELEQAAQALVKEWLESARKSELTLSRTNAEDEPEWATELQTNMRDLRMCAEALRLAMERKAGR